MKKILFLFSILSFSFSYGQTTLANKLRITNPSELSTNTQVVTRGTATGETGYVLKSDLTDVLKYATASAFPLTGVVGKLYYDIATDLYYKWDGATYEEFGAGGTETDPLALKIASNLGDLASASTARTNLGLGTLATQNGTFSDKEDVSNKENTTLDTSTTKYPTNNLVKASIDARVSQYNTYFINTATGNNATGVYEDATKPFATIDYVLGLGTYEGGTIFLQNAGTFVLNGTIPDFDISIKSDQSCTLDFSSNSNTNLIPTSSTTKNYEINLPFGIVRNEKSGASGSTFNSLGTGNIIFKAKELYSNQSNNFINYFASTNFEVEKVSGRESVLATVDTSTQKSCNDIEIKNFVCLASNSCLISGAGSTVSMSIGLISGTGNYRFSGGRYNIGNITTTGTTSNGSTSSNFLHLNFKNSTITSSGGIELGNRNTSTTGVVITGNIASCPLIFATAVTNVSYNSYFTKFINFSANFGTGTYNQNHGNVIFENCSIKSTNSPITLGGGTAYNSSVEIKNSTFEVVNSVPLITGGASSGDTVKVSGLSTNATVISDQSGTGVTVSYIGKQSVATAVNPNDAVTKAQLDAAVISGGGGADLSTTYAPTTVTIVSSSGTDATVNAVDGTNAGIVTPTQKGDWDAKQTASQVTTAISSRISNDPYNPGWSGDNNAADKAVLYDKFELTDLIIADKQPLSAVLTATTASFTTADETKLDGIATGATANSSDATLLARANHTGTQPASTISDFNTATDTRIGLASINALSDVNITSPTTDQVLVYDGLGDFRNGSLTTGSISDFNSATRAQVEAELVAGTNITITPSGTGATRQLTIASTGGGATPQTGQLIVTSGTSFTTPSNITTSTVWYIELVGGGGGGGATAAASGANASGGGGGGYCFKRVTGLNPSTTYTCAIGQGGAGGTAPSGNGSAGTSTTLDLGTIYTASGGGAGSAGNSASGGAGGTGTNGDINLTGESGGDTGSAGSTLVNNGKGGDSPKGWGQGGKEVQNNIAGQDGRSYGGGGSAGHGNSVNGGSGASGMIYAVYFN